MTTLVEIKTETEISLQDQQRPNVVWVQLPLTNMSFGSEVKDGIDAFCVENVIYQS